MKGKILEAYIQAWRARCSEGIERSVEAAVRARREVFGEKMGDTEAYREYVTEGRNRAREMAETLAPHFPQYYVEYHGDHTELAFVDTSRGIKEYRPCVLLFNRGCSFVNLDNPRARAVVNKSLPVLGINARISWRNGAPAITKGYRIQPSLSGWEIKKEQ